MCVGIERNKRREKEKSRRPPPATDNEHTHTQHSFIYNINSVQQHYLPLERK